MTIEPLPESSQGAAFDEAGRHSRIEELLLEGLDHYFAARYEHAITVWTRVAFLERGHGRARAYIERARSAQAEQQRQAEELVHAGVAAYHAGELGAAHDLLTRAVNEGGPHDTALAYLQRLSRADTGTPTGRTAAHARQRPRSEDVPAPTPTATNWPLTMMASAILVTAILVASLPVRSLVGTGPAPAREASATRSRERLPVMSESARALSSARALVGQGHPREALAVLGRIAATDAERSDADVLAATIQRQILAGVPASAEVLR